MKKILSILLVMAMLLSVAPAAYAEADEYENNMPREERQARFEKLRARELEERAYQLSMAEVRAVKAAGEDEAELFAAPVAFKENVTITLPLQDSVRLEFKTPFTEWPDLYGYLVDEDGNEVEESWVNGCVDGEYDEDADEILYSYFDVEYIYDWSLDMGEYKLYLKDWNTGKVYGPVTVLNPGYQFYGVLQTGRTTFLDYNFFKPLGKTPEKVDFKLVDSNGKSLYGMDDVGIVWSHESGFQISVFIPASVKNGTYDVETTVYYQDGTKEELIPCSIKAGNFAYVENIDVINRVYDEYTESIYAEVMYSEMPIDMSEYEIQIVDRYGNIAARRSDYELIDVWDDGVRVMYTIDATSLTENDYEVVVDYSGDKEFYCQYSANLRKKSEDSYYYPSVSVTKKISDTKYAAFTSGFDAGAYTVYDSYNCTTAIGTMTIEIDGMGEIVLNESYNAGDVYVKHGEDDRIYIYLDRYNVEREDIKISSVTPGFIRSSAKSIEGFKFAVMDFAFLTEVEIGDVTLVYNGATVAEGENVAVSSKDYTNSFNNRYMRTTFSVDFEVAKTLSAGDNVTLKVETAYGTIEYNVPVVSGTDTSYKGYSVNVLDTCYMGEDVIYNDPDNPYDYSYCHMSVGEDVKIGVSNINRTSFTATLYKYNAKTCKFDKLKTLKSSSMTKSTVAGYAYYYQGTFSNLDNGYYMVDVDGKKSDIFKVITDPVI